VKTAPGSYDGCEVMKDCPKSSAQFAVRGLGSQTVGGPSAAYQLCDAVEWSAVFGCGGEGIACTTEGATMDVLDWRAVHTMIERAGRYLKANDWSLEVHGLALALGGARGRQPGNGGLRPFNKPTARVMVGACPFSRSNARLASLWF